MVELEDVAVVTVELEDVAVVKVELEDVALLIGLGRESYVCVGHVRCVECVNLCMT